MSTVSEKIQMVDKNGNFTKSAVQFIKELPRNQNITVVSIIGPQSGGKSSLLNHLFQTNFEVLDRDENNGKITEGIWMAKCTNFPSMVIIDVEGSDTNSRLEDGPTFDCRVAYLAFTISDVLLVNIAGKGLRQVYGGCMHLIKTIFLARKSFLKAKAANESSAQGKTRIVMTLRDCNNTKNKKDHDTAEKIFKEYWESCPDENNKFEDHIELSVVQFPNATGSDSQLKEFQMKVDELREQLVTPQNSRHASAPSIHNAATIWTATRDNNDLKLPSFNTYMSKEKCDKLLKEKVSSLHEDKDFIELKKLKDPTFPKQFQSKLKDFVDSTLKKFDEDAAGITDEIKEGFKTDLRKKIVTELTGAFTIKLNELQKDVERKYMQEISKDLTGKKKRLTSSIFSLTWNMEAFDSNDANVHRIVHDYKKRFEDLFEGCYEEHRSIGTAFSKSLTGTLEGHAQEEKKSIEGHHRIYVFIGRAALAATVCAALGASAGAAVGVAAAGAPTIGAAVGVALTSAPVIGAAVGSVAGTVVGSAVVTVVDAAVANHPILSLFGKTVKPEVKAAILLLFQNIIFLAAENAIQHIMKHKEVTGSHMEYLLCHIILQVIAGIINKLSVLVQSDQVQSGNEYSTILAEQKLLLPKKK